MKNNLTLRKKEEKENARDCKSIEIQSMVKEGT